MKTEIPKGLCQCGCGGVAPIIKSSNPKRGLIKGHPYQYIKGHHSKGSHNPQWNGGRRKDHGGHILVKMRKHPRADSKGYVFEHILIAEKALGKPLPSGAVIHHHTPEQLVICQDNSYHLLVHRRQRAFEACGHASWRKCWICKRWDAPEKLNIRPLNDAVHRSCKKLRRQGGIS